MPWSFATARSQPSLAWLRTAITCGALAACAPRAGQPSQPMLDTPRAAGRVTAPGVSCGSGHSYHLEQGCVQHAYGEPLTVISRNELGESFVLIGAAYALDGEVVFDANDPQVLARPQFPVLTGQLSPKEHELSVRLFYRGHGSGIFSYMKGYRFRVESHHRVVTPVGRHTRITAVCYERGDVTTELADRPAVRFEVRHERP